MVQEFFSAGNIRMRTILDEEVIVCWGEVLLSLLPELHDGVHLFDPLNGCHRHLRHGCLEQSVLNYST